MTELVINVHSMFYEPIREPAAKQEVNAIVAAVLTTLNGNELSEIERELLRRLERRLPVIV
ncbi:MAG TPA: hypothetical protein PLD59_09730 [Tepidisphaeraceae bacterium]|nr:hypothetical protein [Tepidisphaeraceae bacterium]